MIIARVDSTILDFPVEYGGPARRWGPRSWRSLSTLLVRVETDDGLVGWGEAFSYSCAEAVQAALQHMIAPSVIGRDASDIAGINRHCQQSLHLFGRYGLTLYALSGLDIALWDIAGKAAARPLHALLGGACHERLPTYASLFHYGDPVLVAEHAGAAQAAGYASIKLHETREDCVRAAREALGDGVPLMVDTNCPWTPQEALSMARRLAPYDLHWLEEPIFPPEDFQALAMLRARGGVAIAAGENYCTSFQFRDAFAAAALDHAQPSVTKVGGITEMRKVAALAEASAVACVPHSPYFGPGWLATLHLLAATPTPGLLERFYCTFEASSSGPWTDTVEGMTAVPHGPGLGHDPDPAVLRDYARKA